MNVCPCVVILRTSSFSGPICSWCLVQLILVLEKHHFLFTVKSFSLNLHLNACVCCSSDTIANSFISLPTVIRNECHKLSTCTKNWNLYEESKILQKWICPVLKFSTRYLTTKNVFKKYPSPTASDAELYCSNLFWWSCCFCLLNFGENMHMLVSQE